MEEDNFFAQFHEPAPPPEAAQPNFFAQFHEPEPPPPQPEAEGVLGTGARELAHGLLPSAVGGGVGALTGAATGALAGSFLGPGGALVGGLAGGVAAGLGAGVVTGEVQESALKAMGYDDSIQRAVNAKANPLSSFAGSTLSSVAGGGLGAASRAARAISGGISGAVETGTQLVGDEPMDLTKIAGSVAGGAAFARNYGWQNALEAKGAGLGARAAEAYHGKMGPEIPPDYHGAAAPKTSVGASETPAPPRQDTEIGLAPDNKPHEGERIGYAKDIKPKLDDGSSTVHVGGVDPDIAHVFESRAKPHTVPADDPSVMPEGAAPPPPDAPVAETPQPEIPPANVAPSAPEFAPPAAEAPPGPVRQPAKVGANTDNMDVLEYLASQGGIRLDDYGELAQLLDGRNPSFARFGSLVRKGGMTEDEALRKITADAPYLHDEGARSGGQNTTSVNDLRNILDRALRGEKIYQMGMEPPAAQKLAAGRVNDENLNRIYYEVDDFIEQTGANPAFREPIAKMMAKEGVDVETAHDRMVEVGVPQQWEAGADNKPQAVIPGAEQIGQGELAQRASDRGLQAKVPQKGPNEGFMEPLPDELFAERKVTERGRSGRPIKTEPLPIGNEEGVIEAGLRKVQETPRPDVDAPRTTEAMARMTREELEALTAGKPVTKGEPSKRLSGKKLTQEGLAQAEGASPISGATQAAPPVAQTVGGEEIAPATRTASARKNGEYGYKAVVKNEDGRTQIPNPRNFKTREEAIAYAQKFIDANDSRAKGVRSHPKDTGVVSAAKPKESYYEGLVKRTQDRVGMTKAEKAAANAEPVGPAGAEPVATAEPKPSAPAPDPIEAASNKILADLGITPTETGGTRSPVDPNLPLKIDKTPSGEWRLTRGNQIFGDFPDRGEAMKAKTKLLDAEGAGTPPPPPVEKVVSKPAPSVVQRGTPAALTPTGGGAPPANVGAAVRQGAGGGGAPPPPGGGPSPPPPGPPPPPNMAHTPPQQRGWLSELWRDVQRKTAAHLLGPMGMEARRIIRGAYGENYRLAEQTAHILKQHQETIRAMDPADRAAMINQMQGDNRFPNFQPTPEQKAFMRDHERAMQEWEAKLHTLPDEYQIAFRDNYMAQMYQNPNAAPNLFAGAGKRGGAGSTKHRKYATYEEAKDAGLVPHSDDPIEISTRYINSIKDFVASRQVMERAELGGTVGYFKGAQNIGAAGGPQPLVVGGPPPGWKKLDTPSKGGKDAYAPEDFADAFNNFYAKGFGQTDKSRNVYEAVRNSTNSWTQLELGISTYHLFTMANEAIISDVGGALQRGFKGDWKGAGQALKDAPWAPYKRYVEGKIFQKDYLDPNSTNPIATILAEANARPIGRGHAADYTFQDRGSFINKFDSNSIQAELRQAGKEISKDFADAMAGTAGQKALFPLRQAGRALQTVSAPIFDKYIPALKAGAVHSQMKDWHAAMIDKNPAFDMVNNPADRRVAVNAAMKIVDSVDNRFGEMIHDNMFMNATLKQSAQVAMRSFSWAIGAMKEIGGGTVATGKALYKLAESRGAENRFDMTHPEWDPRMAYAIAFPFVVSAVSTMYQMLLGSHDLPKDWRDLYAPRTGGEVPGVGGRGMVKEHVLMPGYQKDVMGWTHHPLQEAYNKLGGLPQTLIEQGTGKDWKGQPIVRPNASLPEIASDRMAHIFTKLGPISVKNMTKGSEPGTEIPGWQKALGFRAPGGYIQDPEGYERSMKNRGEREWKAKERRERKIELRQSGG